MGLHNGGATIALTAALTVVLAGCSLSGRSQQQAKQQVRNDAAVAAVHDTLAKTPGVVKVDIGYSNYITNPGAAQAILTVERGTDLERVADLVVEAVWRSQLDPLESITVGVGDNQDSSPGLGRIYDVVDKAAELKAKYGPRPVRPS